MAGIPIGNIFELATSIHSPITGHRIRINGSNTRVKVLNYSPSPAILVELFCSKLLLMIYLDSMLMKAKGTMAGIPDQNIEAIIMIR